MQHSYLAAFALVSLAACSSDSIVRSSRAAHTLEALSPTMMSGIVGSAVSSVPTVRVRDQSGNPLAEVQVAFEVVGGGSIAHATSRSDRDGVATVGTWMLGQSPRPYHLLARANGVEPVVFVAVAAAGPVARVSPMHGNHQWGLPGTLLPDPLDVLVNDSYGNPIANETVTFAVVSGAGSIEDATAITDDYGRAASGAWRLGTATGTQQARAQAQGKETLFTAIAWEPPACCSSLPDSGKIAFVSARDGNAEIYTVNPDGTDLTRLTDNAAVDDQPAWSPDGRRIAFASSRDGSFEIYVMNADGSNVVRRTFSASYSQNPTWSPDGTRIAYSTLSNGSLDLWVVSPDSGGPAPKLLFSAPGWDDQPAWSPDGTRLALVSDWLFYDFGQDVFVITADGSGFTALTGNIFDNIDYLRPSWSPNGARLAVTISQTVDRDQYVTHIGVMNPDGSALTTLAAATTWSRTSWSPDGQMIAFTSRTTDATNVSWVKADGSRSGIIVANGWNADWRR